MRLTLKLLTDFEVDLGRVRGRATHELAELAGHNITLCSSSCSSKLRCMPCSFARHQQSATPPLRRWCGIPACSFTTLCNASGRAWLTWPPSSQVGNGSSIVLTRSATHAAVPGMGVRAVRW